MIEVIAGLSPPFYFSSLTAFVRFSSVGPAYDIPYEFLETPVCNNTNSSDFSSHGFTSIVYPASVVRP
jgi:hypothetical protein